MAPIFGWDLRSADGNWLLALITLGEGWHNNHHHYAVSARQGFFWWEIDITYYLLRVLEKMGIISDLRPVPAEIRSPSGKRYEHQQTGQDQARVEAGGE